ncbi:MAG TPA: adenylate/guanylate cyclase domain-containing protein [Acidimicrobiales bacterium]|nr:adenylate/guanylate cyclase domain-containing protein [Acidimicrobiales bacterium]
MPIIVLAAIGLMAGGLVTAASARSIAEPLGDLRRALERVEQGDLSSDVVVSHAGQIGMLQAGFNRMLDGLRDRQQLQDLFGRHVGAEVAREALTKARHGDISLGGERREASVLFVDLVGSTGLAQSQSPERVMAALNSFFDVVVRVVAAEGGWVNKFEGDGALCVFGAPVDQPDHADRALRAARTLRRELLVLAATGVVSLDAGIGVSSGDVVAGNVGTAERLEYTVIGDPVNEAARLTEEAKRTLGRVLASEEAIARASTEERRWSVAGELGLRGRTQTTLAYEPATSGD